MADDLDAAGEPRVAGGELGGDPDDAGTRRPRGALEQAVMTTLWTAEEPLSAGEVRAALGGDLAYTTVLTILSRLHGKGWLVRSRAGRAHRYAPAADEAGLAARRMRRVLDERVDRADRATVLARFVDDLSDDDEVLLRRLLEE